MTVYSDICAARQEWRNRRDQRREEYFQLAKRVVETLVRRFEIPTERFRYLPLDGDPSPNERRNLAGASRLDGDGWFRFAFEITFQSEDRPFSALPLRFVFRLREERNGWQISTCPSCDVVGLDPTEPGAIERFLDGFALELRAWMTPDPLNTSDDEAERTAPVGFKLP